MNILSQSSLLVAIVSFAMAFSVLAKNVRNKLYIWYAILSIVVSGWEVFFFLAKVWGDFELYRIHLYFHLFLAPAAIAFIGALVSKKGRNRFYLVSSLILASALLVSIVLRWDLAQPLLTQVVYFFPSIILIQILELVWFDRKGSTLGGRVPRRTLIALGGLLVLFLSVLDHVPFLGPIVPVVGNFVLTFYLFFLGQAVTQQRFLNLRALITRFLVLLGVAVVLTAVYSLLFAWIEGRFGLFLLNSFIVSFLVLMLLDPIQKMVRFLTQSLVSREYRGLEEAQRMAQRRLATTVEPSALYRDILDTVKKILAPEWAALFVLRMDGTLYRRAQTIGHEPKDSKAPFELLSGHFLLDYCRSLKQRGRLPIILDQNLETEIDRSASMSQSQNLAALLEGLRALECNLLLPLFSGKEILGFVTLRIISPPELWGNSWGMLQALYPYFEHAAGTMKSMEVYVRSREKERLAELGEMAAGLAHEIRNPLGAIKGAAQFLDVDVTGPQSKFLKVIVEEVDRLNRVVTQFLDYSKPSPKNLEVIDVADLVSRSVELIRPTFPGVDLKWSPPAQPVRVRAAAEQIKQVLLNLIQNSFSAISTGKLVRQGQIIVNVRYEGKTPKRQVIIEVEDNGPGIHSVHFSKIFIPFFTTLPSGTGLGLSICQKIIEDHQGRIEVATEVGRFTRFSVILPAADLAD